MKIKSLVYFNMLSLLDTNKNVFMLKLDIIQMNHMPFFRFNQMEFVSASSSTDLHRFHISDSTTRYYVITAGKVCV